MRRGRLLFILALILLGIALAVFLVVRTFGIGTPIAGEEEEATPMVRDANIVIAAQFIPRGAKIPIDAVILSPIPSDMVVETMATDIGQVVGRRARLDIARGMPITMMMVTEEPGDLLGAGSDASLAIPPGFTAISIPMSRLSGVAYALRGGDAVDVLVSLLVVDIDTGFQSILPNLSVLLVDTEKRPVVAEVNPEVKEEGERGEDSTAPRLKSVGRGETEPSTGELIFNIPSEAQRPRLVTQRLVENATVLSVGTFPLEDAIAGPQVIIPEEGEGGAQAEQAVAEPQPPDIITLIVSPQDALAINYAMKSGIIDITLTLRAPDDVTEFETSAVSLEYLVSNYRITVPTKLPYGLFPRQDRFVPPSLPNESPGPAQ